MAGPTYIARYPQDTRTKWDTTFLTEPLRCDMAFLVGQKGGIAAIVCDTLQNRVRLGYCYTYLAIGRPISHGTLSTGAHKGPCDSTLFKKGF